MLPAYVVHASFFGILYVLDPGGRLERAPGLAMARMLLPMWAWGFILLTVAVVMVSAMTSRRRLPEVAALYGYCSVNVLWGLIYTGSAFLSPDATFGAGGHQFLIAAACIASARSLQSREV